MNANEARLKMHSQGPAYVQAAYDAIARAVERGLYSIDVYVPEVAQAEVAAAMLRDGYSVATFEGSRFTGPHLFISWRRP